MIFSISKFKHLFIVLLSTLTISCSTLELSSEWPVNMPNQAIFVKAYKADLDNPTLDYQNEIDNYLSWIKRFYQGTIIYPRGWNKMTKLLMSSVQKNTDATIIQNKMTELGIKISVEWAKNNSIRLINSANIAMWGDALRTAAEKNEQLTLLSKIKSDADALLSKELTSGQINRERYYPTEDYDNF